MNRYGISVPCKHIPQLDQDFMPILKFNRAYLAGAKKPVSIAVERSRGQVAVKHTFIHGTPEMAEADRYYMDRLVKTILWMQGGFKIYVAGDEGIYQYLKETYCAGGARAVDADFMAGVYEQPFEVVLCDKVPEEKSAPEAMGRHLDGCRIGFDAGGSDRKVSAVVDGETVYSEEVVWFPKINENPDYHYDGIVAALKSAAEHMPRVDAVGVSSAGVYIDNRTMVASLFLKVPKDDFEKKVKDIYIRAIRDTFGDVPFAVVNDGDVSALAGAMCMDDNSVLGIAMGTSEAVGYPEAMEDEWSGDIGCGVKYFSQDGVIKLAPRAGIALAESLSPAEKLKEVQKLMEQDNPHAAAVYESIGVYLGHTLAFYYDLYQCKHVVYESIGVYLGHTLAFYYDLYQCKHVLLLGRVMSGKGGDIILDTCKKVLADEYPELNGKILPELPDEKFRRVGQSMAAASLPALH